MVRVERNSNFGTLPTPEAEVARVLVNMKQRMNSQQLGNKLVDAIKIEKMIKEERNPKITRTSLNSDQLKISNLIPNINEFMMYQLQAWDFIEAFYSRGNGDALIVSAPTGFGKTEAVLPPVINNITNFDNLAILIFPRRALLLDQLERISKYVVAGNPPRVAIQIDGIDGTLEWTIYNEEQRNIRLRNFPHQPQHVDPTRHFNYDFETNFLSVHYVNNTTDRVELKIAKCVCGGTLSQNIFFQLDASGYNSNTRGQNPTFIGGNPTNTTWTCQNHSCNKTYSISISREDHISLKPNLILTTIDSLPSLFSDPELRDYISAGRVSIILDEIHVYYGSYGSHAASMIHQLASRLNSDFLGIGLSATIDQPQEFGEKIFGKRSTVISPNVTDKKIVPDGETYYFVKSASDSNSAGEFYSLKSQAMIQFGLLSISSIIHQTQKMLTFMDSIDAVSLLQRQTEDAYNNRQLHRFRLDDLAQKSVDYGGVSCKGFNPGNCEVGCAIYDAGECWNIIRHNLSVNSPQRATIAPVWASALPDRTSLVRSHFIYSTSELQLGIDLPDVEHLVQYGTPYTIFDYIQRKGRAGRSIGSRPNFYFLLGDNSNDYVYFAHGANILSKQYRLPLNPDNQLVKDTHDLLNMGYDEAIRQYQSMNPTSVPRNYVRKFKSSWYASVLGLTPIFSNFLSSKFSINTPEIDSISHYSDMKSFKRRKGQLVDQQITEKQNELSSLLIGGVPPVQFLERGRQRLLQEIEVSSLIQTDKDTLKNGLNQVVDRVLNDIRTPNDLRNRAAELANQQQLLEFVNSINTSNLGTNLGREAANFYSNISQVAHSRTLAGDQEKVRALFFFIQALRELKTAVSRTLTSEIVKYVFRSQHFYEVSQRNSSSNYTASTIPPLPPTNYFSTSSREVVVVSSGDLLNSETVDIRDSIYKLFPFRLNEVNTPGNKRTVIPRVTRNQNDYEFDPSSYMDGVIFQMPDNRQSVLPISLQTEVVQDDGVNGVVSFCEDCFRFEDVNLRDCSLCGHRLAKVRGYASPLVDTQIYDRGKLTNPLFGLHFGTESDVSISLTGVELSLRFQRQTSARGDYMPTRKSETYVVRPTNSYGYMVNTHSIKIDISNQKIQDLVARSISANSNRALAASDILHSIAHLWIKCIAMTTGITDEFFSYHLVEDGSESAIEISEIQEGGAGYLQIFVDLITSSTNVVLDSLRNIIDCEEHNRISNDPIMQRIYAELQNIDLVRTYRLSNKDEIVTALGTLLPTMSTGEISEHFPACYDGCPFCIGLSNCVHGREEQFDSLSLYIAREYLNTLVIRAQNSLMAAGLIAQGGLLIGAGGGAYDVFLL